MPAKHALITGATSGIGRALAPLLLARGHALTLAVRDTAAGHALADDLRTRYRTAEVQVAHLDLADLSSVVRLVEHVRVQRLDLLINNAGLSSRTAPRTAQGFEAHWGIMYLGHAALTLGLLDNLHTHEGRVLAVAAYGHRFAHLDPATTTGDRPINAYAAYVQAKLAQVVLTRHLGHPTVNATPPVTAFAAHPGMVDTSIGTDLPPVIRRAAMALAVSPQTSAAAMAQVAVDQPAADTGRYFGYHTFTRRMPTTAARPSRRVERLYAAGSVWDLTIQQLTHAGVIDTITPDYRHRA